jgi:20S proteasome alpha/beta subunit
MMSYKNIRQLSTIPSIVGSLIAGYNEDGTFELYTIEPAGSIYRVEDYDANFGSGMPYMLGLLEKNYNKELTVKQGVDLAFDALKSSTQRDIGSGYGIDIFTITNQGVKKVIEQEIKPDYKESQKKSA